ncbi:MAG: AMP-binding protein, partial [Planctomycetes bacterium]|nr:AMP-binding protein [Planctomycetota bacterium]
HAPLESHLQILRRAEPTAIVGVPSFLKKLAECAEQNTINPAAMSVKSLVCIGEPVRDENLQYLPLGRIIHEKWGADVYSTYASTEAVTTFCECIKQQGGHLHPELAVIEIVDDQGDPVKPGENGEVVLTPLGTEGMPLIRYRTGDISFLLEEPCGCGRNSVRLGPILGRKKQMIKYKGTTLYPQPIAAALQTIPAIEEHYVEVTGEEALSDQLTIHVAVSDPEWDADRIAARLQSHLRVKPAVVIEELDSLRKEVFDPKYRKPMRFVDRRTT